LRAAYACAVLKANDLPYAWQLATEAVEADPRDVQANVAMGKVLAARGRALAAAGRAFPARREFDAADKYFDYASILSRDQDADVLCEWGQMLLSVDRAQAAETQFQRMIDLKPQNGRNADVEARGYLWLGRALRKQGRLGAAIQAVETAYDLNPKMAEPCVELGGIYAEQKKYQKAENYFRTALVMERGHIPATVALARLLVATDDPEQRNYLDAAILFGEAVERTGGRDVSLLTQQAAALALAEYYEQAKECMEKAIAAAKQQKVPGEVMELLLETVQKYAYLQSEAEKKAMGVKPAVRSKEPVLPNEFMLPQSPIDPHPYIVPPPVLAPEDSPDPSFLMDGQMHLAPASGSPRTIEN